MARLTLSTDCDKWLSMCPFRNISDTIEDKNHLLLYSNAWKTQRYIMITNLENFLQINFSTLEAETSVRGILGGPLHTYDTCRNISAIKKLVSKRVLESFSNVVDLLQSIQNSRSILLWA